MTDTQRDAPIDVRLLGTQNLPQGDFPGGKGEVFRVFFTPEVHAAIWKHASESTAVEICGVLVGTWRRDANGPFVHITESIRGEAAENKFAEVTFTHETWGKINAQMDTKFAHLSIVGWYHTHPDFGIFLSDRDCFIQEHFFSSPGQIAHVVDPIRKTEGAFVWREGKPKLAEHFWVGDRIVMATAAGAETTAMPNAPARAGATLPAPILSPRSILSTVERLMIYLCLFLVGWLLSGMWNSWQRQYAETGLVYTFAQNKLLRVGLNEELDLLADDLAKVAGATKLLATRSALTGKDEEAADLFRATQNKLAESVQRTLILKAKFGLNETEQAAVNRIEDALTGRKARRSEPETDSRPERSSPVEATPKPKEEKEIVPNQEKKEAKK